MFRLHSNRYAQWRAETSLASMLREQPETPPERLLQAVWFHQRLRRDQLRALDGRAIQVLHPGFWNREAGPDFRRALIRFGDEPACESDIEVDLRISGWRVHGHHANPNYRNVRLHVVWESDAASELPTLVLKPLLDSPIAELGLWLGSEAGTRFPLELAGQCCAPLRELTHDQLTSLLHEAAFVRLQGKAAWFQARARQSGWEQALWEGLFRALGYKQNLWPMQRLAELRERLRPARAETTPMAWQARLLGAGGLLPQEMAGLRTRGGAYTRQLWDLWWRERESFDDCALPRSAWRFDHIRPANHPQRRLALASHWLSEGRLPARLEGWGLTKPGTRDFVMGLEEVLSVPQDDFWSRHWTLRSSRAAKPTPLLGRTRVTDLAVNVVLPWLWMRAVEGRNEELRIEIERCFVAWPCAEDNSVLRLARQRLLGETSKRAFRNAVMQQGLLQVVKDFCEHSDSLCRNCRFPELARHWPA